VLWALATMFKAKSSENVKLLQPQEKGRGKEKG
jgi:hypothetical protein